MRALVHVSLKPTVLDPQGKAVQAALHKRGYTGMAEIRQGKLFEIAFAPGTGREEARAQAERAAEEILANPVIEQFTIRWEE